MQAFKLGGYHTIHRHTGGLEITLNLLRKYRLIHRHTGGLEKPNKLA